MAVEMTEIVEEVTVVDNTQAGAKSAVASMEAISLSAEKMGEEVKGSAEGFVVLSRAQENAASALNRLKAQVDPTEAAIQRMARAEGVLDRAIRQGISTEEEKIRVLGQLRQQMSGGVAANDNLARSVGTATSSSARFGTAIQQAGFQVGDFAVQVASGQGVLRPFIQQATQLVSMFGPIGAVVGAAGAVIGALAVSLFDATDASSGATDALDDYNRMLATTRDLSHDTAGAIRDLAGAHRDAGVAALEGLLAGAVEQQNTLSQQVRAQQEFVRALQQGPTFGDERRQAENDLAALIERFDQNAEAIDGMNNRLFVLRDALPSVAQETTALTAATVAQTRSLDTALDRLERQIAANDNIILTYGMEQEAIARVEAEETLLGSARKDGLRLTDQQRERMELLLDQYEESERRIRALREETNRQEDAQRAAQKAAEDAAQAQIKAAREAQREYEKLVDSIANVSQEKLGDALFDALKGETLDFAEFLKDTLLRAIADIAAAALTQQIVIPIAAQVIGAAPGLFGLSGGAAQVAQQAAGGGGMLGGINPLSFVNPSGLYNQFAFSGIGQSLGLSLSSGAAGAAAFGASAATAPAALAATGPLGGFGTAFGGATASTGGAVGAAGLGGAAPALTGLGAAMPWIGAGIAALAILGPSLFGGGPSVGPVGIADFSPGLGRRRAFDVPGIDPFTADNGGNGESLRPIAEAIADLIADSADRFSATIDESLRFRVANYGGPEGGSGREAGFEVNAFIRGEAEKRVAEGLSQEQAVFEALKFAIQEAFTFDSATIAEAAANTAGTTTEEILADLDFAKNFEALGEALANLGGTVDANTLALAQQTVAIQQQAEAFAEANAQPIVDALAKAIELFPGQITETISRTVSDATTATSGIGAAIADLLPGESRFVDDRGNEYIGNLPYGSDADRDALGRVILPSRSDGDRDADGRLVFPGFSEGDDRYIRAVEHVQTITEDVTQVSAAYAANLERVGLAVDMAKAGMDLLVDQITGDFEPAVRGPFQQALEQGQANLDALRTHFEDVNTQIAAANEAFPGLNNALIDVTQAISDAQAALLANLQEDFRQQVADALDPETANRRAFVDASKISLTDAVSIGLGGDEPLMRDLFRAFSDGAMAAGLGIQGTVAALDDLRIAAGDAGVTVTQLVDGALAELRTTFERDIQAQINAATGLGGVNVIQDLIEARGQTEADAAALGLNVNDTAGRLFDAQLRQAFDGASLADLGRILDSGQIVDAGARAILETLLAEEALAAARASELAGLESLSTTTEAFAAAANQNARTLRQAANAMLVNSTLSPLDPLARLQESERQLMEAFSLANDSDPTDDLSQDAISRLPGLIQTDNELAREYYASTAAYQERFFRNQDLLGSTALRQESIEQQQLSALRDIEAAITAAGGSGGTPSQQAAAAGFNFGSNPANRSIYDALVAAGLPTPSGFGAGQANELRAGNSAVDALLRAMGFANGGAFVNGMPVNFFASGGIVDRPTAFGMRSGLGVMGEAGPEAIMPLDRINGRLGVRAIVPSNDSGGTVAAINALRDEVAMLRRENAEQARQIASVTAGGSLRVAGAVQDGNATTKRMASSAERNAARPVAA